MQYSMRELGHMGGKDRGIGREGLTLGLPVTESSSSSCEGSSGLRAVTWRRALNGVRQIGQLLDW